MRRLSISSLKRESDELAGRRFSYPYGGSVRVEAVCRDRSEHIASLPPLQVRIVARSCGDMGVVDDLLSEVDGNLSTDRRDETQ